MQGPYPMWVGPCACSGPYVTLLGMQNTDTTTRDGLACFECDHISADLGELHNHIWRNH